MSKIPPMKESAILRQILDYLAAKHVFALRMNTGAVSAEHNGKKRFMRFGVPGQADILAFPWRERHCIIHGTAGVFKYILPTWLECKTETGKQSDLQKSFQAQVEAEGHLYVIARDVSDLEGVV